MIITVNPATEEPIADYKAMAAIELDGVINACSAAHVTWKNLPLHERSRRLRKLGDLMRQQKERHGRLISLEMGKPYTQAVAEVAKSAWVCDYYADHAESFLQPDEWALDDGMHGIVKFEPLGVILGIMPWNFPFWQVMRFAAPALMAGNGIIVKHAPNVTGSAIAIEQLMIEAGMPSDLYRTVHISPDAVDSLTTYMINHPSIQGVSLTGSTIAGRSVGSKAGRAIKRSVLELGGSDPYIILDDADLKKAVWLCAAARLINSGQTCIAAKRFIVHSSIIREFEKEMLGRMSQAIVGDPFDSSVEIGPMARADLRDQLHDQVIRSIESGARLLCGGVIPDRPGYFYPPTLLTGVRKGMAVYHEETFGPVASIIEAGSDDEAIHIANDTPFGLGAAVFTENLDRARSIADRIETGSCFINSGVRSDPRMPFGGIKESGYGRELSIYGIREFVNIKSICY